MQAGKSNHGRGTKGGCAVSNVVGWAQNCRLRLTGLPNWLEGASILAGNAGQMMRPAPTLIAFAGKDFPRS